MIYDCFLFFNELDLLEIRLNTLNPYVDYFVLIESTTTFSGKKKPLYFKENKDRFQDFSNKIIYFAIDIDQSYFGDWEREYFQRECIKNRLINCKESDLIIISDLDEIPNLEGLDLYKLAQEHEGLTFDMAVFYYYLNVRTTEKWSGSFILPYQSIKKNNLSQIRINNKFHKIGNGWHFSYLGGADKIKYKIESYSHQEFNKDSIKRNIQNAINNNKDLFGRAGDFKKVDIDSSFPRYLVDNLEKYNHLIKK
jgi:beta-1,4-mannosyl-glycoprotein beta-1,4-N-acetylglucosaminyltransferase